MNERIKLLAEQARKYAWENETHWSADTERATLFEQKFAELILFECIKIAVFKGDTDTAREIKTHFGITL